eukprot:gene12694-14667_t
MVEHFSCDIELNDFQGVLQSGTASAKAANRPSLIDLCNTYFKSLRYCGINLEIKDIDVILNKSLHLSSKLLSTSVELSRKDITGLRVTSKVQQLLVTCEPPLGAVNSLTAPQSIDNYNNQRQQQILRLPLLRVDEVETILDASLSQLADHVSVTSNDIFATVSAEHLETLTSNLVQIINISALHKETYSGDRFECLMNRFREIDQHKQRFLRRMRHERATHSATAHTIMNMQHCWEAEDETYDVFADAVDAPAQGVELLFHGEKGHKAPINCTVHLHRTGLFLCTRNPMALVQVICVSDIVVKVVQQEESLARVLAARPSTDTMGEENVTRRDTAPWTYVDTEVRSVRCSVGTLETAHVSLEHCLDGRFASHLHTSTLPTAAESPLEGAQDAQNLQTVDTSNVVVPWVNLQYTVTATSTSASRLDSSSTKNWRYAAYFDCSVAPFELCLALPALGTALHTAAQLSASLDCVGKLSRVAQLKLCFEGGTVQHPPAQTQLDVPWKKFDISVPSTALRINFPTELSVSAGSTDSAVAGIAIKIEQLKFVKSPTVSRVVQHFLTVESFSVTRTCDSGDVKKEFISVSQVNLSLIAPLFSPEHTSRTIITAPALTSAMDFERWAASEITSVQNTEGGFQSETSLQIGAVKVHLDRFDLYAVGVLSGVLENSSKVYNPLQHYLRSPVEVLNPSNCAPYKVYVVVVSTTVELQWTPETLAAQELLSTEARSITGDEVTYHLLTDCQISFSCKGLGDLYSHSQLFVHDDILIRRVSTLQGREISSVELLRITNSASVSGAEAHTADSVQADEEDESLSAYPTTHLKLTGFSARRHCLFSTKRLPNELFCAETDSIRSTKRAVGVMGEFTNTVVSNVLISVDYLHLDALCRLMACKSDGLQRGEQYALRHIVLPLHPTSGELALQNDHLMTQSVPTKISAVHIKKFKIVMYYNLEPVLSSTARSVDVHQIAFGPALSQLAVVAHSWYLFELTAKYAVHTCIVGDIDAVTPNRFDLHITSRVGECPLVELQVDQLRLFYLQRSVMVLISFLRDHFISSLYATPQPSLGSVESSDEDAASDTSASADVVVAWWGPPLPACRGLTRLCAVFQRSEVHLPLSSCSTDALVVLIDHTHVYRVYADMTPALTAYCKGPLILRKLWVSELRNSRKLMYLLFLERDMDTAVVAGSSSAAELPSPVGSSVPASTSALSQLFQPLVSPAASDNPVSAPVSAVSTAPASVVAATIKWALAVQAMDLLVPSMDIEAKDVPEFCLAFAMINSLICSWCDSNAVGEETNLNGVYILKPIAPGPNDQPRSTIIVDVTAENLEWTLAQGQYLALINLIQHNFCELQELVPDIFALGPPHSVKLGEKVYGKYALDESLPICDTVPIHIKKGKIIAVESVPEYFELFCVPLPPAHFPYGINGHAIPLSTSADVLREVAFMDTIPTYSKHVQHRDKFFAQLASHAPQRGDKGVNLPKSKSKLRVPSSTEEQREETGESIIGVLFKDLEIDFYRRHDNGGNGIEVSAGTFVIVGIEDGNPEDEDIIVKPPVDIDDLSLDSIIFAPRCFPLLNSGSNRSAFQASGTPNPAPVDGQKASAEDADGNLKFHNSDESPSPVPVPHIKYSQQGTGNLRRCIVSISDSMAVANIAKVLHTVEYFLKPIHVNTHRSLFVIAQSHLGPYDYKIALDMEVHVSNTVVCLTNISRRDGANALCFQLNLDYQQAWRGFLSSGPGLIGLNIDISVMNIYIAPMREINSSRIQSLVDPCVLVIGQEDRINPSTASLETNLALLAPHVKLGKWVHKVNHFETPTNTRIVRFAVAPANRPTTISPSSSSKSKRKKKKMTRNYMSRSKSEVEGDQSEVPEEVLRSVPEDSSSEDGEDDGEESSDDDNDGDVDADDLDDAPQLGDAYYSGAETMNAPTVRVQISLKDIWFIATAVKQARTALNKRLIITTNQEDFFAKSKLTVQDIHHIPRLTYYLVHTPLQVPGRKNRHNELLAEICDFEAILRNNTYNLNILRLNIFDNCMLYTRSPQILHMASGSAAAVWAYNEATDLWEPLVEPFNMRAIGATDESIQAAGMVSGMLGGDEEKKRKGAKIRIEVVTDPLEMNAPQTAL